MVYIAIGLFNEIKMALATDCCEKSPRFLTVPKTLRVHREFMFSTDATVDEDNKVTLERDGMRNEEVVTA